MSVTTEDLMQCRSQRTSLFKGPGSCLSVGRVSKSLLMYLKSPYYPILIVLVKVVQRNRIHRLRGHVTHTQRELAYIITEMTDDTICHLQAGE